MGCIKGLPSGGGCQGRYGCGCAHMLEGEPGGPLGLCQATILHCRCWGGTSVQQAICGLSTWTRGLQAQKGKASVGGPDPTVRGARGSVDSTMLCSVAGQQIALGVFGSERDVCHVTVCMLCTQTRCLGNKFNLSSWAYRSSSSSTIRCWRRLAEASQH